MNYEWKTKVSSILDDANFNGTRSESPEWNELRWFDAEIWKRLRQPEVYLISENFGTSLLIKID